MPLKNLNALSMGSYISTQKKKAALTEHGLITMNTASLKRYFKLKDPLWKGVMVEIQNNQVKEYSLQGYTKIGKQKLKDIFSDLIRMHGTQFNLSNFRSLSKKGYSILWHHQKQLVSLNVISGRDQKCSISLKKAKSVDKPKFTRSEGAILALEPYLGKGFHRLDPFQIAGESNTQSLDQDLNALLGN